MKYFTTSFISFFEDLANNNQKEWFHAHKKRYESDVKKPFEAFISDLISAIQKEDPSLNIQTKDCVLRINRDLRFSQDKTPYNLHYSAVVSNGGRKDKSVPGLFLRFTPEEVGIMGGAYVLDKDQLHSIRTEIMNNPNQFNSLTQESAFVRKYKEVVGEVSKRIPKEFQESAQNNSWLSYKQFYFMAKKDSSFVTSENLLPDLIGYWRAARPLNNYLNQIIHPGNDI